MRASLTQNIEDGLSVQQSVSLRPEPVFDMQVQSFAYRLRPFLAGMSSRLRSATLADITLVADGVEFPCHRLVLAAGSEYWARRLEGAPEGEPPDQKRRNEGERVHVANAHVPLPGHTSAAIANILRIMYFDATARDILKQDPGQMLAVLKVAGEWLLHDVLEEARQFAQKDITDTGILMQIVDGLIFSDATKTMRETCFERLRGLREEAAAKALAERSRGLQAAAYELPPAAFLGAGRGPHQDLVRWPMGGNGEQWFNPVTCPKGLGW